MTTQHFGRAGTHFEYKTQRTAPPAQPRTLPNAENDQVLASFPGSTLLFLARRRRAGLCCACGRWSRPPREGIFFRLCPPQRSSLCLPMATREQLAPGTAPSVVKKVSEIFSKIYKLCEHDRPRQSRWRTKRSGVRPPAGALREDPALGAFVICPRFGQMQS